MTRNNIAPDNAAEAYLVRGGIAPLASAAYLIRDGGFERQNSRSSKRVYDLAAVWAAQGMLHRAMSATAAHE